MSIWTIILRIKEQTVDVGGCIVQQIIQILDVNELRVILNNSIFANFSTILVVTVKFPTYLSLLDGCSVGGVVESCA